MRFYDNGNSYHISVNATELVSDDGNRTNRSACTIGVVMKDGRVHTWTTAGRGFKEATRAKLEEARQQLIDEGKVIGRTRHKDAGDAFRRMASEEGYHNNYARAYGGSKRNTVAQARAHLADLDIVLRKSGSEYRVNFKGGREATAYYTDDLGDAVATGEHMSREKFRGR